MSTTSENDPPFPRRGTQAFAAPAPPPPAQPTTEAPYQMKEQDTDAKKLNPTVKAYNNKDFLQSTEGRLVRILCEFQEPGKRLRENNIRGTILVFGSARSMSREDYQKTMGDLEKKRADPNLSAEEKEDVESRIARLSKLGWMCDWVSVIEELAYRLTKWSFVKEVSNYLTQLPIRLFSPDPTPPKRPSLSYDQTLVVTTGGGPGLMEAANRGASRVTGAKTMGMGISLPFEKGLNPYVSKDLCFEFHYFFTRKFWMMYSAKALIVAPGGFGTMDELFELLTLRQTGKVPSIPIVLICSQFWKSAINWQYLADVGVISQKEIDSLCFADTVDEAFNFITKHFNFTGQPSISPSMKAQASHPDLPPETVPLPSNNE